MRRGRNFWLLLFAGMCRAAGEPPVCSVDEPAAAPDQIVHLKLWAPSPAGCTWSVSGGELQPRGCEADWRLSGVTLGQTHTSTLSLVGAGGQKETCSVRVIISGGSRGGRETARALLLPDKSEEPGFGLYSYFLLGSPPDDNSRPQYKKATEAYLRLSPRLARLARFVDLRELNANYLPVDAAPEEDETVTADWVLEHYDYARARALLRALPGAHLRGPYLVSSLKPGSGKEPLTGPFLYQDLSSVPPDLIPLWYEEFLNQAAQEQFWKPDTARQLFLKTRTVLAVLALGLPDVKRSLDTWIQWIH